METVKNLLLALLLGLFALALVLFPAEASEAARQGLSLCLRSVLPSLFPFFVLSSLFIAAGGAERFGRALEPVMRPLFRLSGAGASAPALGFVGGYPLGARTVAELYRDGSLSGGEAERLLGFCNNAGPGFILGVCGGTVFRSSRAGVHLYLVHVCAAALTGALLGRCGDARRRGPVIPAPVGRADHAAASKAPRSSRRRRFGAFPACVRDSFAAVWSVCGFVVLFAVVLRFVSLLLPPHPLLLGFVELTSGVLALRPDRGGFTFCAVLLAWGGLSVHAQTLSVLDGTGLSTKWYFLGKTLQAALSAPLAWMVSYWLYF